jgi:hypothetical protein
MNGTDKIFYHARQTDLERTIDELRKIYKDFKRDFTPYEQCYICKKEFEGDDIPQIITINETNNRYVCYLCYKAGIRHGRKERKVTYVGKTSG